MIRMLVEVLVQDQWLYAPAAADYDTSDATEREILGLGTGTMGVKPVATARGLPPQHSAEVEQLLGGTNVDRSHLLLSELLDYRWAADPLTLHTYVLALRNWALATRLKLHEVRVVFGG